MRNASKQRGFSVVEVVVASAILLVGVMGVMQLIPMALNMNLENRYNSTEMVFAQRELEQMMQQPLTATSFTDADGRTIALGAVPAASTTTMYGGPVTTSGPLEIINFTGSVVTNYNFQTIYDPNEPTQAIYEMRWAVFVTTNSASTVTSKRFLVGVYKLRTRRWAQPTSLEGLVMK